MRASRSWPGPRRATRSPPCGAERGDRVDAAYAAREDRRRRFPFTGEVTQLVASDQLGARLGTRYDRQLLGTAGPRGVLFLSRTVGTHEGGPFEREPALALLTYRGHLIAHSEYFDAGDAERALARFEELCAG